jgi:hypothetical protein
MNLLVSFYFNSSLSIFLPLKDPIYAVLKSQNNIFNHCQPKKKKIQRHTYLRKIHFYIDKRKIIQHAQ